MATLDADNLARAPHRMTRWISADLAELDPAIGQLLSWLAGRLGHEHALIPNVVLAFSELLGDVIVHSAADQEIRYNHSDDGHEILVRVVGENSCELATDALTTPSAAAGPLKGLALVENLADRIESKPAGRRVDIAALFVY